MDLFEIEIMKKFGNTRLRRCVRNKSSPEKGDDDEIAFKKQLKEIIKTSPKVENFLKKEHVYGRFISAVTKQRAKEDKFMKNYTLMSIKSQKNGFINDSIRWASTTEGHEFWKRLNKKFSEEQTELPF